MIHPASSYKGGEWRGCAGQCRQGSHPPPTRSLANLPSPCRQPDRQEHDLFSLPKRVAVVVPLHGRPYRRVGSAYKTQPPTGTPGNEPPNWTFRLFAPANGATLAKRGAKTACRGKRGNRFSRPFGLPKKENGVFRTSQRRLEAPISGESFYLGLSPGRQGLPNCLSLLPWGRRRLHHHHHHHHAALPTVHGAAGYSRGTGGHRCRTAAAVLPTTKWRALVIGITGAMKKGCGTP